GAGQSTLDSLEQATDGSVSIASTLVLPRDLLPAVATQFLSGDMRIQRRESWDPMHDGRVAGTVDCAIAGAPATMRGTVSLTPEHTGARMDLRAEIAVRIPLVGGKLESFIGSQLTNLLVEEQRFTTTWLARGT
ncbi:MAG: hypothetical protein K0R68_2313, partial [Mycobacterium sp.]|nr:hypothetical protein [Mycobacterium sp.]